MAGGKRGAIDRPVGFMEPTGMPLVIVSTAERADLAALTARWQWEAFVRDAGRPLEPMIARAEAAAAAAAWMPRSFVLLSDGEPVGTASLTAHDLEERPDLTPWLASVYVVPQARGQGHAARLVRAVEQHAAAGSVATLWLYTNTAERIYQRIGWRTVESVQHDGYPVALMRRDLSPE